MEILKKSLVNHPLRAAYEEILGNRITDRTWQRIRSNLLIYSPDASTDDYHAVQGAGLIRRSKPNASINRMRSIQVYSLLGHFYSVGVQTFQGSDIRAAIAKCFCPCPTAQTFRNWDLYCDRIYSQDEALKILAELLGSDRWSIKQSQDIPRVRLLDLVA